MTQDSRGPAILGRPGPQAVARFQVVNALIWAATIMGAAAVVKASNEFIYLLLVLLSGSTCSWAAIVGLLQRGSGPEPRGPR